MYNITEEGDEGMISTLRKRPNGTYYCSNCMMTQLEPRPNCFWCGNYFSNYELVVGNEFRDKEKGKVEEKRDESNISRKH